MITLKPVINHITKEEEIEVIRDGTLMATFNVHDTTKTLPYVVASITSRKMVDWKVKNSEVLYPDGKHVQVKIVAAILLPQE